MCYLVLPSYGTPLLRFVCDSSKVEKNNILLRYKIDYQGVSMYFMSEYSDVDLFSALSDTHVPNVVLYPWQVRMMSQSSHLEICDLSQLRVIITGGSILGPTISRDMMEKLPSLKFIRWELIFLLVSFIDLVFFRESYGLKEAGLLTYNYPKFDKSGPNTVPDDHLMPLGLPNMWTSFKVGYWLKKDMNFVIDIFPI